MLYRISGMAASEYMNGVWGRITIIHR